MNTAKNNRSIKSIVSIMLIFCLCFSFMPSKAAGMSVSQDGIDFIKAKEGFYKDMYTYAGSWLIGYGTLCEEGEYPDGITEEKGEELLGIKVHFDEPVKAGVPLTVHTAVRNMKGITSERGTIIYQNGKPVVKAIANWFLFDANRGRPGKIPADMAESYTMHNFEDEFFAYSKPALCEAEVMYQLRVSNKDIDTNIHLNNQKSAEMLMDALPFDFFFTDMNVYYKKAAVLGDILELCSCKTENGYYVCLQTTEKELCVAGIFEFNK